MELYNEDDFVKKKSKVPLIIGICIGILILITAIIIYMIMYLQGTVYKITLDGVTTSDLEEIFYIEGSEDAPETMKLYIPIRKIASFLGYADYNGDYKNKSEDNTKCYVENEYETVVFTQDSNEIFKTRGNSDYEIIQLDEKVFSKDGELYTTIDGIEKAYNVEFLFEPTKRNIEIYTMGYLLDYYAQYLQLEEYSVDFSDQKAIFEGMIIVIQNEKYGVIDAETGNAILETKYDEISYLPNSKDFLVKTNGKYGIVAKDTTIKVRTAYDNIQIMDNKNGLYLVKLNNSYGVLNTSGNTIIEPMYQQIGIGNINDYSQNGIESQYIILDELIPVKNNNLWGFFNLKGEQITEFKFTQVGSSKANVTNSYPVLAIPSYKIIIVQKDGYYNLMQTDGKEIIRNYALDSVYMTTNTETGENTFHMTYGGKEENIEEWLAGLGY